MIASRDTCGQNLCTFATVSGSIWMSVDWFMRRDFKARLTGEQARIAQTRIKMLDFLRPPASCHRSSYQTPAGVHRSR